MIPGLYSDQYGDINDLYSDKKILDSMDVTFEISLVLE